MHSGRSYAQAVQEMFPEGNDEECLCGSCGWPCAKRGVCCCCCHMRWNRILEVAALTVIGILAVCQYLQPVVQMWPGVRSVWGGAACAFTLLFYLPLTLLFSGAFSSGDQPTYKRGSKYFEWGRFRKAIVATSLVFVIAFFVPQLVLLPQAFVLAQAIEAEFGVSDPISTSSALSLVDWLFHSSGRWGDYESAAGTFSARRQTYTYLADVQEKPGFNNTCVRPWLASLDLDVYIPYRANNSVRLAPIIFHIHGDLTNSDSWGRGTKEDTTYSWAHFLVEGYGVVSSQYHFLCEGFSAYEMLAELTVALDFVRANATQWGLDPDRIFLTGFGAGSHLALMLGYSLNSSACGGWKDCGVRGVFNLYGATRELHTVDLQAFTGTADKEKWREAFPLSHVSADVPPTMSMHGSWDSTVPYSDATALHQALKDAGAKQLLITATWFSHRCDEGYYGGPAQMHRFALERLLSLQDTEGELVS